MKQTLKTHDSGAPDLHIVATLETNYTRQAQRENRARLNHALLLTAGGTLIVEAIDWYTQADNVHQVAVFIHGAAAGMMAVAGARLMIKAVQQFNRSIPKE